jgi:hypothetical protein
LWFSPEELKLARLMSGSALAQESELEQMANQNIQHDFVEVEESREVSFEWEDGPNANAEFHKLYVYSPLGELIDPRMDQIAYQKNGQWSYGTQRVFVPEGSLIFQADQNTSRYREIKVWIAAAGRPQIFYHGGQWGIFSTWPSTPKGVSEGTWRKILRERVHKDVIADWEKGISSI